MKLSLRFTLLCSALFVATCKIEHEVKDSVSFKENASAVEAVNNYSVVYKDDIA